MLKKATRQEEEAQTLRKFIENKGEEFQPGLALYRGMGPEAQKPCQEPCDVAYDGVEYQITYGDTALIGKIRKKTSGDEIYCDIRGHSEADCAEKLLGKSFENKRYKSDDKMTLLIDCTYASTFWHSLSERESIYKKYFLDNEQRFGGLWQHISIVFSDGNIQLR